MGTDDLSAPKGPDYDILWSRFLPPTTPIEPNRFTIYEAPDGNRFLFDTALGTTWILMDGGIATPGRYYWQELRHENINWQKLRRDKVPHE